MTSQVHSPRQGTTTIQHRISEASPTVLQALGELFTRHGNTILSPALELDSQEQPRRHTDTPHIIPTPFGLRSHGSRAVTQVALYQDSSLPSRS